MKPMVTVYPRHCANALEQVNRWMGEGFVGLKIWVSIADEPCVYPLIERMIEFGKPTLIHAMHKSVGQLELESDPVHIANLARRYPDAKIILPHIGGNFIYTCEVIADIPNIYTDPSGSYCETGMVEHAVRTLGVDRVMFGSDAPGADFVNNLAKVLAADLSERHQRQILAENARTLWGWA
jgi:predicted TIM-barrel fold metal-dependent hydrolase